MERKSCTLGNAAEVRLQFEWRRMTMGRGWWLERKAPIGHNSVGGSGGSQKKGWAREEELHFGNRCESEAMVLVEEDGDGSGTVVGE